MLGAMSFYGSYSEFFSVALLLFLVISLWYAVSVERRRRQTMERLNALVHAWIVLETNENRIADQESTSSLTYPVHAAKSSAYRGCITDLQRALYCLTTASSQKA